MTTDIDPDGRETAGLYAAADFRNARVLEIGCGSGRLTRRYAPIARSVVGVDSALDSVTMARAERPRTLAMRVGYVQAGASMLPFGCEQFDVVIFGWSL